MYKSVYSAQLYKMYVLSLFILINRTDSDTFTIPVYNSNIAFEICNTGFRTRMVNLISGFTKPSKNGVFINSCFTHCQTENHDTWYSKNSPAIKNKVGNIILFFWVKGRQLVFIIDHDL